MEKEKLEFSRKVEIKFEPIENKVDVLQKSSEEADSKEDPHLAKATENPKIVGPLINYFVIYIYTPPPGSKTTENYAFLNQNLIEK